MLSMLDTNKFKKSSLAAKNNIIQSIKPLIYSYTFIKEINHNQKFSNLFLMTAKNNACIKMFIKQNIII